MLFEEVCKQDGLVAFRTATAESDRSAKELTGSTSTFADEAFLAARTLVQGVRRQLALPLQETAEV